MALAKNWWLPQSAGNRGWVRLPVLGRGITTKDLAEFITYEHCAVPFSIWR